jgi:uncharacterized protein YecE (DUF72 family)
MLLIGTSGFSYDDWVGPVYPQGLPARDYLAYYAGLFPTVELNVTYYRIPAPATVAGWVRKTPDSFLFSVKAFGEITHQREDPPFAAFVSALAPLIESRRLGAILAQFPYSFHPTPENTDYLRRLRAGFGNLPVVVEFRNAGWIGDEVFDLLRSLGLGFCCVDEPRLRGLMPPIAVATSNVAYLRFHGRNAARWYDHEQAWERYNYTYSDAELREWASKVRSLEAEAPTVLVYFNNHFQGQAVKGARDLGQLLLDYDANDLSST